jgi:hypothetical protein
MFTRPDGGFANSRKPKPGPFYCVDGCGEEVQRSDSLCTACFQARHGGW